MKKTIEIETLTTGREQGWSDACDWIEDERRSLATCDSDQDGTLADTLRAALRPGQIGADESLINALSEDDLAGLVGCKLRDEDGDWTADAREWFRAYNRGWTAAIEDRLAEASS